MTSEEKKYVVNVLEFSGWRKNRIVNPDSFSYTATKRASSNILGSNFYMFATARNFLSNFGGLNLEWISPKSNYNSKLYIDSSKVAVNAYYLKWYMIYTKKLLYPVTEYQAMPGDLLIDIDGKFYFVCDTYFCEVGDDFFEILNYLFKDDITASLYKEIPYWEDAGYSDEFIEQWNYDFDILK